MSDSSYPSKAAADLLKASPAVQRKIVTAYRENPEFRRRGWALTMPPTPGSHRHPWLKNHRA